MGWDFDSKRTKENIKNRKRFPSGKTEFFFYFFVEQASLYCAQVIFMLLMVRLNGEGILSLEKIIFCLLNVEHNFKFVYRSDSTRRNFRLFLTANFVYRTIFLYFI